ncbi:MAG: OmpA family protein [Saprospiraceae bacterium]
MMQSKSGKIGFILWIVGTQILTAQYKIEKLGPEINSDQYDEISPVVTRNGRTLYFTRIGTPEFNRTLIQDEVDLSKTLTEREYFDMLRSVYSQIAEKDVPNPVSSNINQDIWVADSRDQLFDRVYQPGFPLNNALPNSVCSLSPDDNTLVIINHFSRDGSMFKGFSFMDRRADGSYSFPDPIYVHDFYSYSPEVNISMSKDGDVIILSLKRKEGFGENDLYVSFKLKYNLWSEPVNLGPVINTPAREVTPFLSEDKTRLFFASNRPGGKGGMDIYVSRRLDYSWTKWTDPQPLAEPINSIYDDSNPIMIEPNTYIYFTSKRDGTSDIFRADLNPVVKLDQSITLRGTIKNSLTQELMTADLYYGPSRLPTSDLFVKTTDGKFELTVEKKDLLRLSPRKIGFVGKNQLVDVSILAQSKTLIYEIDFYLTPLENEQKVELQNIYFERGTPEVLASSFPELDKLANLMNQNKSMQVRIEGHTDSVGIAHELLDLSRSRAESIKKYLVINKHIGSDRINTVGYGGTRPISPNNSESNRSKNRRVEIYITQSDLSKKIKLSDLPDPTVKPIGQDGQVITSAEEMEFVPELKEEKPNQAVSEIPFPPPVNPPAVTLHHFGDIIFIPNQLAIKESSFVEIRKLVDHLINNGSKKITLVGMCSKTELLSDPGKYALQRAMGVKEYLIFKSIDGARVTVDESQTSLSEFAGVKILITE